MTRAARERLADWLIVLGAAGLFLSLFLPWSDQFSRAFLTQYGSSEALLGVPHSPTAWQVYSAVDVLLALLACGLVAVALRGGRIARLAVVVAAALALAFTVHALGQPPTNHADIFAGGEGYVSTGASAGAGEVLAVVALCLALVGLGLSFTVD